ncbi:MAG: outer membrane protein transport protein [Bacteroidota bacterium]
MYKYILIVAGILASGILTAQNEVDALRYSFTDFNGSARYTGMAGSMGALGGDLSAIYGNPASIAVYRSSEFSLSPGISINNSEAVHYGTTMSDSKLNFNLGNLGFALAFPGREGSKIKYSHFGVNYNRIQEFQNNYSIQGTNSASSLSDVFANQANGLDFNNFQNELPFTSFLAWETFLINPTGATNEYVSEFPGGELEQIKYIETKGRVSQTDLAFGLNYDDRLHAGASIGLTGIQYTEESTYRELIREDYANDQLEDWTYLEELETSGTGINFNIGLIYKITDAIRLGGAWHSPTYFYELEDIWRSSLSTNFQGGESYSQNSPDGFNIYNLRTPSRYQASIAYVLGKKGLINIDYESVNYAGSKLNPSQNSPADFTFANEEISKQYQQANNIRIGGEYRFLPLSVRAGFAYYENPFQENIATQSPERLIIAAGLRFKLSAWSYFDFALKHTRFENDLYLYDPALVQATSLRHENNTFRFTYGTRF